MNFEHETWSIMSKEYLRVAKYNVPYGKYELCLINLMDHTLICKVYVINTLFYTSNRNLIEGKASFLHHNLNNTLKGKSILSIASRGSKEKTYSSLSPQEIE